MSFYDYVSRVTKENSKIMRTEQYMFFFAFLRVLYIYMITSGFPPFLLLSRATYYIAELFI